MKAVVQNLENGKMQVDEVPSPALLPDGILVRIHCSLISLGTERAIIALARKSPIGKAKDRPDLARKVINKAKQEGFLSTYKVVKNLMSSPIPLGYSCAGKVIDVGRNVTEFRTGDMVACAGLNYANHAEVNYVPRNLAVKMPEDLSFAAASFVTVGAIAMQGHRLAGIALGERVVVMGLGLVGQIVAQLARCAGATVLAADPDPFKVALAKELGAHLVVSDPRELTTAVAESTDGHGADAVLICAATKSDDPIRQAAELSRLKGRVVVVGDVGMNIERRGYFEKEIDLVISRSYGPGRYDPAYEVRGIDYPLSFVRWTEGRNMLSFLELVARKDIRVDPMITHSFDIDDAEAAYRIVTGENSEPAIAIVLQYKQDEVPAAHVRLTPVSAAAAAESKEYVTLGVIGAGQFAKGVLLPEFAKRNDVRYAGICTSSGLTSKHIARRYKADFCTSNPDDIFGDDSIDAVVIATRHDQHADLAIRALQAGKAVFVEKPLAITPESLLDLCKFADENGAPRLMVGYNRRFAPLAVKCRDFFAPCKDGLFASYRVNAGHFPPDSWVYDPVIGGGRILGEICHFVDFLCYLTDSLPVSITATELVQAGERELARDNVSVTLQMSDGSVGTVHYLANGDTSVSKEYVEVFGGRRTAILDNYRTLSMHQNNRARKKRLLNQAKGFQQEVTAFVNAVKRGEPMPIEWETLVAVTQTTFLIHRSLDTGGTVTYEPPTGQPATFDG